MERASSNQRGRERQGRKSKVRGDVERTVENSSLHRGARPGQDLLDFIL